MRVKVLSVVSWLTTRAVALCSMAILAPALHRILKAWSWDHVTSSSAIHIAQLAGLLVAELLLVAGVLFWVSCLMKYKIRDGKR